MMLLLSVAFALSFFVSPTLSQVYFQASLSTEKKINEILPLELEADKVPILHDLDTEAKNVMKQGRKKPTKFPTNLPTKKPKRKTSYPTPYPIEEYYDGFSPSPPTTLTCPAKKCRNFCIDSDDDCCPGSGYCDGLKCFNDRCYPWDALICPSGGYCNGAQFTQCCTYPERTICASSGRFCCPNDDHTCAIGEKCCGESCIRADQDCCSVDGSYCADPALRCCIKPALSLVPIYICKSRSVPCLEEPVQNGQICGTHYLEKTLASFSYPEFKIPCYTRTTTIRFRYAAEFKSWCTMSAAEINGIINRLHSTIDRCIKNAAATAVIFSAIECYATSGFGCGEIIAANLGLAVDQAWECIQDEVSLPDIAQFLYGAVLSDFGGSFTLFVDDVTGDWKCF